MGRHETVTLVDRWDDEVEIDTGSAPLIQACWDHDLVSQELVQRQLETLRAALEGPCPDMLETLLVDRICTCWLAVQHAELIASKRLSPQRCALSNVEENRLDKTHRRFLSAIRELARVRKLLTPEQKLQINVGAQQHVVNMA